jgi:hypothetical protein
MPTTLTTRAIDKSTYVINCAFTDENGAPVIPESISWTLTNDVGTVINSRTSVDIAVPAASVDIVLSGEDLDYTDGAARVLTVNAVYDSSLGSNLPLKDSVRFMVSNLVAVT